MSAWRLSEPQPAERTLDHADPFDRMLVAQAISERATLVSHDRAFEPYDAEMIWT